MTETVMPRCRRTADIVEAILEGNEPGLDRAHLASCTTCSVEADRAMRFTRGLVATTAAASEGIPDASLLAPERSRLRGRTGQLTLRFLTLAGAVAAGLVIAAVIGSRALAPTGRGPSIFGPSAAAQERVEAMDLACGQKNEHLVECTSLAKDHRHEVLLTLEDGEIVGVKARISSTNGKPLDVRGANVMFARFASAVVTPGVRSGAVNWVANSFAECGSSCSAELDGLHLELNRDIESVVLILSPR
jgi:hypothetical protein